MMDAVANYNEVWIGVGIFISLVVLVYCLALKVINHAFSRRLGETKRRVDATDAETDKAFERIERGARPSISRFKL